MNTTKKKFSGWLVLLGCFLLTFFSMGIIANTSSLFMQPICTEFGFSTSSYSFINLIGSLTSAVAAMLLAPKMQKQSMKKIMIVCAVVAGGSFFVLGLSSQLWQFFLFAGVANAALAGITNLPVAMLVTNWFQDKRSIAMSIAFCGAGTGASVWSKLFGSLIAAGDWRTCYYIGGVLVVLVSLLAIILLVKPNPQMYGQEPYTNEKANAKGATSGKQAREIWLGLDKKQAIKTPAFVMLSLAMFFLGCLAAGVATHSIYYLTSVGWEMSVASNVLSVYSLASIIGLFLGGFLFDKFGPRGGTFVSVIFGNIGIIGLILAENHAFGYVYAIFFALSMMMSRLLPALLTSDVFGVKDYGSIYSFANLFFLLGCALGAVITGFISNAAGYFVAWIAYIVICTLIFVCTAAAVSSGKKLREQYPNPTA